MNSRYVPPPTAERMRIPGAAPYLEMWGKTKGAAGVAREETEKVTTNSAWNENKPSKKELKRGANNPPRGPTKTADEGGNTLTVKLCAMQIAPPEEELAASATAQQPTFSNNGPRNGFPQNTAYRERASNWRSPSAGQGQVSGQVGTQPSTIPNHPNAYTPPAAYTPRGFLGTCNLCQAVGHRASVCPEVVCYGCNKKGHTLRSCPDRPPVPSGSMTSCQVCGTPGVVFNTCGNCAHIREALKNGQAGGRRQ